MGSREQDVDGPTFVEGSYIYLSSGNESIACKCNLLVQMLSMNAMFFHVLIMSLAVVAGVIIFIGKEDRLYNIYH